MNAPPSAGRTRARSSLASSLVCALAPLLAASGCGADGPPVAPVDAAFDLPVDGARDAAPDLPDAPSDVPDAGADVPDDAPPV